MLPCLCEMKRNGMKLIVSKELNQCVVKYLRQLVSRLDCFDVDSWAVDCDGSVGMVRTKTGRCSANLGCHCWRSTVLNVLV